MTRKEIAQQLAEKTGMSPSKAREAVNNVFHCVQDALKNGDSVNIRGFATIDVVEKKARKGYDFNTKKTVEIPAHKVLRITAGKEFKEALNGK